MESEFISWLRQRVAPSPRLTVAIGDDAAVLRVDPRSQLVLTSDMLMDGVDFVLAETTPERVGRKALAANLSDLAAMAARPVGILVSLALPRPSAADLARRLIEGLLPLAAEFETAILGGDTNCWEGPLAINITAVGETSDRGPLRRGGARPGDVVLVTGSFGGSILGRHFDFTPRVREALELHRRYLLHAGTDVSDGLSLDLSHIARESGCAAVLELERVPIATAAIELARREGIPDGGLEHALGDGEDFELILAATPQEATRMVAEQPLAGVTLTAIGRFEAGEGLWRTGRAGGLERLMPRGFQH